MNKDIIGQVRDEYALGYDYVRPKVEQYRDRIRKRDPQTKKAGKININMITNTIDSLIAVNYTDSLSVKFVPRDGFLGQEQADLMTNMAEFDNREADYEQMNYQVKQDRLFFGCGLRLKYGWDDTRKVPLFNVMSPMTWISDPLPTQTGQFDVKNYRFHGFRLQTTMYDLIHRGDCDKSVLNEMIQGYMDESDEETKHAYDDLGGYQRVTTDNLKHNFSTGVYYHYTIWNGKKTMVLCNGERTRALKVYELPATLAEEKKDPSLIPRPVVINYFKPRRYDPRGESICDKLEDKQDAKTILFNLNVIKARKEALGGDFLVNSRLVNRKDLLKPAVQDRYIGFDDKNGTVNMGNVMAELPRSQIKADSYNMIQNIDRESNLDTGVDSLQAGIVPDKSMTKAEAQQIQANANVKVILNNRIDARGERAFRFLRWRCYQEYLSSADEKIIILNPNFEYRNEKITRDKIFTTQQPYIMVGLKSDLDAIDEQQKAFMNAQLPIILQDPDTPKISKVIAKREMYRLNGKTANQINRLAPLLPDERKALELLSTVNQNEVPKSLFSNTKVDLFTIYVYMQKAIDNDAKESVLKSLEKALAGQDGGQPQQPGQEKPMQGAANAAGNIMMGQAMQGQGEGVQSRGSVIN